jgi:hypothetical protein
VSAPVCTGFQPPCTCPVSGNMMPNCSLFWRHWGHQVPALTHISPGPSGSISQLLHIFPTPWRVNAICVYIVFVLTNIRKQ